ncbi:helix-turn-helix domain-containing protein [Seonamhaeicola marinus]|uniref:Helix-turn-helix transcriptional regulator n=1 Tax=Seonamhaeicola marinus TaxID=1912246 RepID=A0A5D0HTP7_9FLAO|nr:AraC family transcriptional regulator [Seonamhaeicola marinus]TYA74688.1 helix-turn-helix transcriptional regulator [Seonamhaeicola marinus]
MFKSIKQKVFIVSFSLLFCLKASGFSLGETRSFQIDSLIQEKSINSDMTQLELLILYQEAWAQKHKDSIGIFKNLALLNAELEQPEDALLFTEKYIHNTLDLSILEDVSYESLKGTSQYEVLDKKYKPQIGVLAFIYFCVALIGFYFMVVMNFIKNVNGHAKLFMGCFIGVNALFILEFVLFMTNVQYQFPHTYRMASIVALLFGPFLFFYFKSIVENHKFRLVDCLHFLPFVIFVILFIPLYILSSEEKLKMMLGLNPLNKTYDIIIFVSKIVSLSVYAFFTKKMLFSNEEGVNKHDDETWKWKRNVYVFHMAYIISYLIYGLSIFNLLGAWSEVIYYLQITIMSVTVVYIAHNAYLQPDIFKRQADKLIEKYQKSGLTNALSEELKQNLINLFINDKIYKENAISLEILSNKLNTTRHNTSQIINEHFNMNFFELINKFRIKEAVNMFKDDVHGSLNIIDVAYEVGYNNKVTFNKAFKKEMSVTPSEYIQSITRNS